MQRCLGGGAEVALATSREGGNGACGLPRARVEIEDKGSLRVQKSF